MTVPKPKEQISKVPMRMPMHTLQDLSDRFQNLSMKPDLLTLSYKQLLELMSQTERTSARKNYLHDTAQKRTLQGRAARTAHSMSLQQCSISSGANLLGAFAPAAHCQQAEANHYSTSNTMHLVNQQGLDGQPHSPAQNIVPCRETASTATVANMGALPGTFRDGYTEANTTREALPVVNEKQSLCPPTTHATGLTSEASTGQHCWSVPSGKRQSCLAEGKRLRLTALRSHIRMGEVALLSDGPPSLENEPQQKARRKKHRPKVKREGKPRKGRRAKKENDDPYRDSPPDVGGHEAHDKATVEENDIFETTAAQSGSTHNHQEPPVQRTLHEEDISQIGFDRGSALTVLFQETALSEYSASASSAFSNNRDDGEAILPENGNLTLQGKANICLAETPLTCNAITLYDFFAPMDVPEGLFSADSREIAQGNEAVLCARQETEQHEHGDYNEQKIGKEIVLHNQIGSSHAELTNSYDGNLTLSLMSTDASSTTSTALTLTHTRPKKIKVAAREHVTTDDNLQMVVYNQKREIVLSRQPRTTRKVRAKVPLDTETQRVWLLLENGAPLRQDADAERAREWERERAILKGRVESFIEKMHAVQGDRRFSRWKGSIVDSVVGAFLTQNVSDHLSSSAFMSVASRFPAVSRTSTGKATHADGTYESLYKTRHEAQEQAFIPDRHLVLGSAGQLSSEEDYHVDINKPYTSHFEGITTAEVGSCEGTGARKQSYESARFESPCCEGQRYSCDSVEGSRNMWNKSPESQSFPAKDQTFLPSDDERHSSSCMENLTDDAPTMRHEWATSRVRPTVYSKPKTSRKLNFGSDTVCKDQTPRVSNVSNVDEQANMGQVGTLDFLSDQQSESGAPTILSSSLLSGQDSNFQLTTVMEGRQGLGFQAETARESPVASNTGKKRPLSLSSISGLERAQLEENQKGRKKNYHRDWESVRKKVMEVSEYRTRNASEEQYADKVDWNAVRNAGLQELAETIKERGMHHVLSGRIKAFLRTLYEEHGRIDLEWLRDLPTEDAREYLMSIHGLGVKSVECIRLLTLHHLAFPVDTNVGRICVRLGWVPIEPLPEELQLHLLELYPIQESIQKYLWPRLCTLDQKTLYELHYQLITFGKVFCTKSKPNCNACPMRTECKHFASAYASAKPLLTGPTNVQSERICSSSTVIEALPAPQKLDNLETAVIPYPQDGIFKASFCEAAPLVAEINCQIDHSSPNYSLPTAYNERFYVEEPLSPEFAHEDILDLEDMGENMQYIYNDVHDYTDELIADNISLVRSKISLQTASNDQESCSSQNMKQSDNHLNYQSSLESDTSFSLSTTPLQNQWSNDELATLISPPSCPYQCSSGDLVTASPMPSSGHQSTGSTANSEGGLSNHTVVFAETASNAIIAVPDAAQLPAPKLKNVGRLRTIHYVYELPDGHPLLQKVDARENDDPCSYLLAIWSPDEVPESQQQIDEICTDESHESPIANTFQRDETVSGTLLIPCRTAMHGSFPLNGTYFQVNEVFADHESSLHPLQVSRSLLWNLPRRFVYFGTSVPNIFRGLSTKEITTCFWRGHVCVRGFDRKSRAPKPLVCRLHFPISKQPKKPKNARSKDREV